MNQFSLSLRDFFWLLKKKNFCSPLFEGLWGLEVSYNQLREVPSFAFRGLKYALWELHLHHNQLTNVPAESIMVLEKLAVLNLAGREISLSLFHFFFSLYINEFTQLSIKGVTTQIACSSHCLCYWHHFFFNKEGKKQGRKT